MTIYQSCEHMHQILIAEVHAHLHCGFRSPHESTPKLGHGTCDTSCEPQFYLLGRLTTLRKPSLLHRKLVVATWSPLAIDSPLRAPRETHKRLADAKEVS
jgi:hypothetical protein